MTLRLFVKKLSEYAVLPTRASEGSAGYDLSRLFDKALQNVFYQIKRTLLNKIFLYFNTLTVLMMHAYLHMEKLSSKLI